MIKKKTILIAIMLAYIPLLFSQDIVDPTKMWSIMEEHCQPWGSTYSTNYFRFEGDTIVDDKNYKKVLISEDENHQEWNFFGAFIREVDGKVYFKEFFQEEGLIYDFNLQIGDSVVINNTRGVSELTLFLVEVDSVEVVNGYRERWRLVSNEYENSEYWIMGIGSETGVINSGTGVFGGLCGLFTLLCEKENDELVYIHPEYGSCFLITSDIENNEINNQQFALRYNPDNRNLGILTDGIYNQTILVTDISGKVILKRQISSSSFSFNFLGSPNGIYIVAIIREGIMTSQKIIVY